MKTFGKFALAIAAIVGLAVGADAITYYKTITENTTYKGYVQFENPASFLGEVTMSSTSGTLSAADVAASDDLTVGDDATVTGDLAVTSTTTLTGGIVNGSHLSTTANGTRIYSGTKTLTEAGGAETLFTLTTATTQMTGGYFLLHVRATDTTDYVARTSRPVYFVCNNLAATVQVAISDSDQTNSVVGTTNAKTLTYALANTAGTNTCVVSINIDSDMTVTAASAEWTLFLNGPGTIS